MNSRTYPVGMDTEGSLQQPRRPLRRGNGRRSSRLRPLWTIRSWIGRALPAKRGSSGLRSTSPSLARPKNVMPPAAPQWHETRMSPSPESPEGPFHSNHANGYLAPIANRYTTASSRPSTPTRRLMSSSKKAPMPHGASPRLVAARYTFSPRWPASNRMYR